MITSVTYKSRKSFGSAVEETIIHPGRGWSGWSEYRVWRGRGPGWRARFTASMGHGCFSAGVRRVPDGLARVPGALRGRFFAGTKVPPVSTAGTAGCPECQELPGMAGRLRVAGQSDFRTRVFRASESSEAGQPPFPVRHRPAARRHEPGIHRIPARRRHPQDRQACFSGNLRWHSSRGFHNHAGACRPAPATGAFRPEPAKPETQTHPPPG